MSDARCSFSMIAAMLRRQPALAAHAHPPWQKRIRATQGTVEGFQDLPVVVIGVYIASTIPLASQMFAQLISAQDLTALPRMKAAGLCLEEVKALSAIHLAQYKSSPQKWME